MQIQEAVVHHLGDIAIVFATLMGPVFAVQAQRVIDKHRERRRSKDLIFRTLMATRALNLSPDHVRALNTVELEYSKGNKEKPVMEAWRALQAHLNTKVTDDDVWGNRRVDFLVDMLYEMSKYLNYNIEKTQIRTSYYLPVAHGTIEEELNAVRHSAMKVLKGESPLWIVQERPPEQKG